ncbi:MAG: hypothetical protein ACR2P5_06780 [Gammaproteobacteria bacterium]
MSDLLKRLDIIQNAIAVGDEDIVALQAERLPEAATELRALLAKKEYAAAAVWLADFRKDNFSLAEYQDPEIGALLLEVKNLENEIVALAAEKGEYDRIIAEFDAAYISEVGDILEKLLRLRAKKAAPKAEKARREYEEYKKTKKAHADVCEINDDEKIEIKKLFKQSASKCHPDKLPEDKKNEGKMIFQELESANRNQDIRRVREIWQKLQDGDLSAASAAPADKNVLRRRVAVLREKADGLRAEIAAVLRDDTWRTIQSLAEKKTAWADYFAEMREKLRRELEKEAGG